MMMMMMMMMLDDDSTGVEGECRLSRWNTPRSHDALTWELF